MEIDEWGRRTIVLFGEAERGRFEQGYHCRNVEELSLFFGEPPIMSRGIPLAIRALLFGFPLIYFRVEDEGFSLPNYYRGFEILRDDVEFPSIRALALPGVGDTGLIMACALLCRACHGVLLMDEADFYDYMMSGREAA